MLGAVVTNNYWKQACLPISKNGFGMRQANDQIKATYVGFLTQSSEVAELLSEVNPIEGPTFIKSGQEINISVVSQRQ